MDLIIQSEFYHELLGAEAAARDVEQDAAEAGVDAVLSQPISWADLEELLELTVEERGQRLKARGLVGTWAALPVSVGAAVVAMAVLMIG